MFYCVVPEELGVESGDVEEGAGSTHDYIHVLFGWVIVGSVGGAGRLLDASFPTARLESSSEKFHSVVVDKLTWYSPRLAVSIQSIGCFST